jgi:ribulose-5-phosphate 4-epimerase/fuculose-1-phosphate aldolase
MTITTEVEGTCKFNLAFEASAPVDPDLCAELESWRRLLHALQLTGMDPLRYGGLAYGNVSHRLVSRKFLISGSQTGSRPLLNEQHYCVVDDWNIAENRVAAHGPLPPSSETLSHAAAYEASSMIQCVLHIHSPRLWQNAEALELVQIDRASAYGTPEIAMAIREQFKSQPFQVVAMGGHEDGLIATGASVAAAMCHLLHQLAKSHRLEMLS